MKKGIQQYQENDPIPFAAKVIVALLLIVAVSFAASIIADKILTHFNHFQIVK